MLHHLESCGVHLAAGLSSRTLVALPEAADGINIVVRVIR
jgi:hypothetical protein